MVVFLAPSSKSKARICLSRAISESIEEIISNSVMPTSISRLPRTVDLEKDGPAFIRNIHAAYDFWMLRRTSGILILFTVVLACSTVLLCPAQQAQPSAPVRHHFGDDPDGKLGWANPNFDNSAWPVAHNGLIPSRSRETNRFFWDSTK